MVAEVRMRQFVVNVLAAALNAGFLMQMQCMAGLGSWAKNISGNISGRLQSTRGRSVRRYSDGAACAVFHYICAWDFVEKYPFQVF